MSPQWRLMLTSNEYVLTPSSEFFLLLYSELNGVLVLQSMVLV